jgi:hypothetical protein
MSKKSVDNPGSLGWEDNGDGFWSWAPEGGGGSFPEAPEDGNQYARQDADWSEVVTYDGTGVESGLAAETQARADGDAALQGQIDGIADYDDTGIKADLATETQARTDGDAALQGQIDAIPSPVPAPVDSVNSKTGAVVLSASDVGAKPSSYSAPVDSVNGKTGAVSLSASDVGAQPAGAGGGPSESYGKYNPVGDMRSTLGNFTWSPSDGCYECQNSGTLTVPSGMVFLMRSMRTAGNKNWNQWKSCSVDGVNAIVTSTRPDKDRSWVVKSNVVAVTDANDPRIQIFGYLAKA